MNRRDKHHQKDREFLARVAVSTLSELEELRERHRHKGSPEWKKVAIARAIYRKLLDFPAHTG